MTDDEAAIRFQKERKSIISVLSRHYPQMDTDTIDMLYTDCWESVQKAIHSTGIRHFNKYMYVTVLNRVKDYFRSMQASHDIFLRFERIESQGTRTSDDDETFGDILDVKDSRPYESEIAESMYARINAAMEALPRTLALVGNWYYVEEFSLSEIAEMLHCSKAWAGKLIIRFRRELREKYFGLHLV